MPGVIIVDTSCLIVLDKIDKLDILDKLYRDIVVTTQIAYKYGKPLPDFISIQNPINQTQLIILSKSVDKGEASGIALALEKENPLLIIDDRKAKALASALDISVFGTLGLLAEAKLQGHIKQLKPVLAMIRNTNFRITEAVEKIVLQKVGEEL